MTKNNKARFFYGLCSDEIWAFEKSEGALGPIVVINNDKDKENGKSQQ